MLLRYVGTLAVTLTTGFAFASVHCRVSPGEVLGLFDLADSFGDDVSLKPFDDAGAFPWWVFGGDLRPLAVIENVYGVDFADGYLVILDAQYLDGNDLIVSAPVSARQMRSWKCAS